MGVCSCWVLLDQVSKMRDDLMITIATADSELAMVV